jgi:2,4-dienoyl-CoA reductase-like NADH-dependent reductase (Old Yellow Enzyme family)
MWQPPQRIKHELPDASWPSADEAAAARLYQPLAIGPRTARQRTWVPAMVPWRSTEEGFVTRDVIDWYRRFAEGRPGVIVVEATGIREVPSGPLLRIGADRFIPGLRDLVAAVKEASHGETLLFIQLIDFLSIRRRPPRDKYFSRFLQLTEKHREALFALRGETLPDSDVELRDRLSKLKDDELRRVLTPREFEDLERGYRERVTDMHLPHIAELPAVLPGLFADAADRAKQAGFDGVELHFAHAYTMASFLSALNTRPDGYGGSRENRVKLPREVVAAVDQRLRVDGKRDVILGCRYLGDDVIEGGNRPEDAAWFGVELARAGLDFLSISKGGKFEDAKPPKVGWAVYPYTGQSGYECMPTIYSDERGPFARNVSIAGGIRHAVNDAGFTTPIVAAGGICEFAQAEAVLERGEADFIASARQSLADPDWFLKIREGRGSEIRRCEFTNYCEALDQQHKQVTCKLWDRDALDAPDVTLAADGKRRLVAPRRRG